MYNGDLMTHYVHFICFFTKSCSFQTMKKYFKQLLYDYNEFCVGVPGRILSKIQGYSPG